MEALEQLASITRLSERVLRVLGQNPGKMTLQGTNTYIIGSRPPFILFDTGEGKPEYIPILESALRDLPSPDPTEPTQLISDVILSHEHGDHWGGLYSVLTLLRRLWDEKHQAYPYVPPRLHKFPNQLNLRLEEHLKSLEFDTFIPADNHMVLHDLEEKQTLGTGDSTVEVYYTPGHTTDSICLLLSEEKALFTADTVLGAGTAVFTDLTLYITSLQKLVDLQSSYSTIYPGHGPVVEDGPVRIQDYIDHRLEREREIIKVMSSDSDRPDGWTPMDIVSIIYTAYPKNLWDYASRGVTLHLKKLEDDGRVIKAGGEHVLWKLVSKL